MDKFPKCGLKEQSPINIITAKAIPMSISWEYSFVTYGFKFKQGISYIHNHGNRGECKILLNTLGACKVKKNPKKHLDIAHSTRPPNPHPYFFLGNPSLIWTEHTNHNNQQLLAMYNTDRIHRQNQSRVKPFWCPGHR